MSDADIREDESRERTDLLHRACAGLDVTLFWDRASNELTLRVVDFHLDQVTEFDVPADRADYAFHHPLAYWFESPTGPAGSPPEQPRSSTTPHLTKENRS